MSSTAPHCKECGTELKELLFSRYCPNEENHGKGAFFRAKDKAAEIEALSWSLPPTALYRNNTIVPAPGSSVPKTYYRKFSVPNGRFKFNAQTKLFVAYEIVFVPSLHLQGWTIQTDISWLTAYVSGQHRSPNGKSMVVTLLVEGHMSADCVVTFQCHHV